MATAPALPHLKLRLDWDEMGGHWVGKDLTCQVKPVQATTIAEVLVQIDKLICEQDAWHATNEVGNVASIRLGQT